MPRRAARHTCLRDIPCQLWLRSRTESPRSKHMADQLADAELQSKPLLLKGLIAGWPAALKWAGKEGLKHLQKAAGSASVQAIRAPGGLFYGNIEQVDPVPCTFADLLEAAQQELDGAASSNDDLQLYLAQQTLHQSGLEPLLEDIQQPPLLSGRPVQHTNLWMCSRPAHSSIHFDPYHNLLCVVTGTKTVTLMDPGCTPGLYARPLEGESSNHSSVNFTAPDLHTHPLYRFVEGQQSQVTLGPGDALFIPEGWWHQVDSGPVTLAVNYWWPSRLTQQLQQVPHLHHYYMRMLASALTSAGVQQLLDALRCPGVSPCTQQQQQQQQQRQAQQQAQRPTHDLKQQQEVQQGAGLTPAEHHNQRQQLKRRAPPMSGLADEQPEQQVTAEGLNTEDLLSWRGVQYLTTDEQRDLQHLVVAIGDGMPAAEAPGMTTTAASAAPFQAPADVQLCPDEGGQHRHHHQQQQQDNEAEDKAQHDPHHHHHQQQQQQQQGELVLHAVLGHIQNAEASRVSHEPVWDAVSTVLARCSTSSLVNILHVLAHNQPGLVQQLFHQLTPVSAHLLAQHMDATDALFDQQAAVSVRGESAGQQECQGQQPDAPLGLVSAAAAGQHSSLLCTRTEFFAAVYGCLSDAGAAFQRLLARKEQLATVVKAAAVLKVL